MTFFLQFSIVLLCIFAGARVGGIALGAFAGVGLCTFAFVFQVAPTSPPIDVLLMILSVITAASTLQAAGGLDYLVCLAERALRKKPALITFVAPLVSYFFTLFAGTGHIVYAILPVIAEVSKDAGVRPERPLSVSAIASQQAITACPISAATVSLLGLLSDQSISLMHILIICIPSTLIGCIAASFFVRNRGKELHEDPFCLKFQSDGNASQTSQKLPSPCQAPQGTALKKARLSIAFFLIATLCIVAFGACEDLRPSFPHQGSYKPMNMAVTIEMVMLCTAAAILSLSGHAEKAVSGSVAKAGFVAIISIFGIAWLGDTFVAANASLIHGKIGSFVHSYPFAFTLALFVLSILLYSQAATVLALMPLGVALEIPAPYLIAMFPAVNGFFFLPTYGTALAAIAFDPTGSTKIGKYIFNHSFMLPGLVATTVSICVGSLLSFFLLL